MEQQYFNVVKMSKSNYSVKTKYNTYFISIDKNKGIGIYLELPESNTLIKSYRHNNILTAIKYLFTKSIF